MIRTTASPTSADMPVDQADVKNPAEDGRLATERASNVRSAPAQRAHTPRDALKTGINLPQLVPGHLSFRRMIRRRELRQIVPLADSTIYEMERRGEFPRRFPITSRCVVWDLEEVEAWLEARRQASCNTTTEPMPMPDVRLRRHRPVK